MRINEVLVIKLEKMSKLALSNDERVTIIKELEVMVNMFDKIGTVNTEGIEPLIHMSPQVNCWRHDSPHEPLDNYDALKNAAESEAPYCTVPKVIE